MIVPDVHKSCQGILYPRPFTSNWHLNETLEQFLKNCKNFPDKMQGWQKESVEYTLNKYGFRSRFNFDKFLKTKKTWIALGCSKTFGIGLQQDKIYTTLLEKKFDCNIVNLAVPGGSLDSCYRVCKVWFDIIQPDFVIIQKPHKNRREELTLNGTKILGPWSEDFIKFKITMQTDNELNDDFYETKILDAINQVIGDTKSFLFDFNSLVGEEDYARDLIHSGPKSNYNVFQNVSEKIKQIL